MLEWNVKPIFIIDRNKNMEYFNEKKFIIIFLSLLLFYLFSKLSFIAILFLLAGLIWILVMFIFGSDKMENRSSSFKYIIDKKGIAINNLTLNKSKFYFWNSLKYFYYNRKPRRNKFIVTVIDNNMQRIVMSVPLKYIDEVDSLLSNCLSFKHTVIKSKRSLDLLILYFLILLISMFIFIMICLIK